MNIVYAAELPSIASLLSDYTHLAVRPEEIHVSENPDETGSFYVGWDINRYVVSPDGRVSSVRKRQAG